MTAFIVAAMLLTAVVVALLARPLLADATGTGAPDRGRLNAALLRDEFDDLERDRARGALDESAYVQARDDLSRRLLDEAAPPAAAAAASAPPLRSFAVVVLALPLAAGLLYAARGTPQALLGQAPLTMADASGTPTGTDAPAAADPQVAKMVDQLQQKLKSHPDDPAGWAMLGRSYTVLGRYGDAIAAFERIGATLDGNAGWLAEFADAAAMQAGGNPVGRPEELAQRALRVDPDNQLALMMASYGAAARGDFTGALPLIEHGLKVVPADSDDHRFLEDLLAKSRARQPRGAGEAPPAIAAADGAPPRTATGERGAAAVAVAPTALSLEVGLAPALQRGVGGKVLFLIARAPGERMPLAVIRQVPRTWPVRVVLDDRADLDPARALSSVARVQVEARVSATGSATAAPDDLVAATEMPTGQATAAVLTIEHRRN